MGFEVLGVVGLVVGGGGGMGEGTAHLLFCLLFLLVVLDEGS